MSLTEARSAQPQAIVSALNQCIEICIDGAKGYASAAAYAQDPELKSLLQQRAEERGKFVLALQSATQKLRMDPENEGTTKGTLHRGWMDIRRAAEGRSDRVVVQEWARGERAALKGYKHALERTPLITLPLEIRTMIQAQYASIRAAVDEASRRLTLVH